MRMAHSRSLILFVALFVVAACSGPLEPDLDSGGVRPSSSGELFVVGPEGGVLEVSDGRVSLTFDEGAVIEDTEVSLSTTSAEGLGERLERLPSGYTVHDDVVLVGTVDEVELREYLYLRVDVSSADLEGRKVYVATWDADGERWREVSADFVIDHEFTTLVIILPALPVLQPGADPVDTMSIAVLHASLEDETARCEAAEGEWMDLTFELEHPNGYCAVQGDDYWDGLHPDQGRHTFVPGEPGGADGELFAPQVFNPSFRGSAFIITANVGHTIGNFNCCNDMLKLSNASVEQRIHDNLNALKPDLLLLQEMGNRHYWDTPAFAAQAASGNYTDHGINTGNNYKYSGSLVQIMRLIKDAGVTYRFVCTRYMPGTFDDPLENQPHYVSGMAFECIVWNTARFHLPSQLPGAFMGYTIGSGGAGISLQQKNAQGNNMSRRVRVASVHLRSNITAADGAVRIVQMNEFRAATQHAMDRTLWGGDFNMWPTKPGADGNLFRNYVQWGALVPSDNGGIDFLRPLRTENQTTANLTLFVNFNLDHVFASSLGMPASNIQCTVLYQKVHRLDYFGSAGGGMDHRAVACGTSFNY